MQISKSYLIELYKFFMKFKPQDARRVIISSAEPKNGDVYSLRIHVYYDDRPRNTSNLINLKYDKDYKLIIAEDSTIKKNIEYKVYGHEEELHYLFSAEGKFIISASYKPSVSEDIIIYYTNFDQEFGEEYKFKNNTVTYNSKSWGKFEIEDLNEEDN